MFAKPHAAALLQRLSASVVFREYAQAFSEATRLPLSLRPTETWDLSRPDDPFENPFCTILAGDRSARTGCLESQTPVAGAWRGVQTRTVTCFAGLTHSTVPLHVGGECIGFLHTGQVALEPPTPERFDGVVQQLAAWGANVELTRLEAAYWQSRVLTPGQYHSTLKLLEMFVQHLTLVASQVAIQETGAESSPVCRAKRFIAEHQGEAVTLAQVARTQHMSTFYFCKTFKKATGHTFTDYLGRVRIETAKILLLNPNRRVSEVAYEVGFGSLTHFNRLFSRHACQSPTAYRAALPALAGARAERLARRQPSREEQTPGPRLGNGVPVLTKAG